MVSYVTLFLIRNATLLDGSPVDIVITDGEINRVERAMRADWNNFDSQQRFDADGRLVTSPLIEPHIHLDATLTAGEPTWNRPGTLAEGTRTWAARKESLTKSDVKQRARTTIEWLVSHGVTRVRTHADTTETSLIGVEALVELREEISDLVESQLVAFPQDGIFTGESHEDLLVDALKMGVDVVGGIPHNEHTREDGVKDVHTAVDLAKKYGLPLDLHIDETDDPQSRFTEVFGQRSAQTWDQR
jgi:cytosine deaminase